jgi:hypothetical protein
MPIDAIELTKKVIVVGIEEVDRVLGGVSCRVGVCTAVIWFGKSRSFYTYMSGSLPPVHGSFMYRAKNRRGR